MLTEKPHPVDIIELHYDAHRDELDAEAMAHWFGHRAFPGIRQARFSLLDAGLRPPDGRDGDYYLEHAKTLCIGVCGGQFDEHQLAESEFKNSSAATRMAEWLEIQDDPGLKPLLANCLHADRKGHSSPFELAALVKSWWGAKLSLPSVLALYRPMFNGLYHHHSGNATVLTPSVSFAQVIADWVVQQHGSDVDINKGVEFEQIQDLSRGTNEAAFGLRAIWEAMIASGQVSEAEAYSIICTCLNTKYAEQSRYAEALESFGRIVRFVPSTDTAYRVAVAVTDNDQIVRSVRKLAPDTDILIKLCTDGHRGVFDINKRFDRNIFAFKLRLAENRKRRGKYLPPEQLNANGTIIEVPEWYNWREGAGTFCGTPTAPHAPLTDLDLNETVTCVLTALHDAWSRWHVKPVSQMPSRKKKRTKKPVVA